MNKGFYWVSWTERHDAVVEVSQHCDDPADVARRIVLEELPPMGERLFEFEAEIDEVKVSPITSASLREFADLMAK